MGVRFYVCGEVRVEAGDRLLAERDLPSRQGRLLLARLVLGRQRALSRAELAEALWDDRPPRAYEAALSALLSRLRRVLGKVGLPADQTISTAFGCHQLQLPGDTWVDFEAARSAVHQAEIALARGDIAAAFGPSGVSAQITSRAFLSAEQTAWVEETRAELKDLHLRALECVARVFLANGEHAGAVRVASRMAALEPLRESAHQLLMRGHAATGNRAEALATYASLRKRLGRQLGVEPSAATRSVYRALFGD